MSSPFRDENEAALVQVERLQREIEDLREQLTRVRDGRPENEEAFMARLQERARQAEEESARLRLEVESLRAQREKLWRDLNATANSQRVVRTLVAQVARWFGRR